MLNVQNLDIGYCVERSATDLKHVISKYDSKIFRIMNHYIQYTGQLSTIKTQ